MQNKDIFGKLADVGDLVIAPLPAPKSGLVSCMVCKINASTILVEPLGVTPITTYRVKQFIHIADINAIDNESIKNSTISKVGKTTYENWIKERNDFGLKS